jgi:serine/threonine protein kinase
VTRYELLDRIGVGGMAEIFRGKAVAAGGFEKPVAIKRILPHLSQDKRFVELLIAEAKVLSLLKHRNIVQIFDVGLGDDGKYFLVMEYVDGKDLGAIQRGLEARRRRLPFDLALHIGAEICEALEHAHSARAPDGKPMALVHRDVSPSNVLMSRAGEIKLTDFGIAKRAEQESTGHGAVRGKFAYISPEQARNEHVEPRSDVFSVAILLWELVTNRRLFSGLGDMEALRAVREANAPRPRDIDGRLSPEVDALIMSALAPEPRARPTAGQLGARLRSMRYGLEHTVGDPATELAKIIDTAEEVERQSSHSVAVARAEFEGSEATVIRIHTADAFSMRDNDGGMAQAREVIDRFEEEETRQAQLSRDQMAFLRAHAQRDSGELSGAVEPPLPGVRPRSPDVRQRASDEMTSARDSISTEDFPTLLPDLPKLGSDSGESFEGDEATRLLAPAARRTPIPERPVRIATQPPPMPGLPPRQRPPTPGPPSHTPPPGTVHDRSGRGMPPNPSGQSPNGSRVPGREATASGEAARVPEGNWHSENPGNYLSADPVRARRRIESSAHWPRSLVEDLRAPAPFPSLSAGPPPRARQLLGAGDGHAGRPRRAELAHRGQRAGRAGDHGQRSVPRDCGVRGRERRRRGDGLPARQREPQHRLEGVSVAEQQHPAAAQPARQQPGRQHAGQPVLVGHPGLVQRAGPQ